MSTLKETLAALKADATSLPKSEQKDRILANINKLDDMVVDRAAKQLRDAIAQVEAEHPEATTLLNRVLNLLSAAGV